MKNGNSGSSPGGDGFVCRCQLGMENGMMGQAPLWELDRAKSFVDVCA